MHVVRTHKSRKVDFSVHHQSAITFSEMNPVKGGEERIEGKIIEGWRYLPL